MDNVLDFIHSQISRFSEFDIYVDNSTETMHNNYSYKFAFPFEGIKDPVWWTINLQKYWHHSITICMIYLLSIKLLQFAMRYREPFQLKKALFYWNTSLAVFSYIGCIRLSEEFIYSNYRLGLFKSVCYTMEPHGVAAFWALMFGLSKVLELGDTYFIVLRKRPLIFLHCYHHIAVVIGAAHGGASHAAHGRFFVTINLFVHSIMYTYYACTSCGLHPPKFISMCLTTLQIVQMFLGVGVNFLVHLIKLYSTEPCQQAMGHIFFGYLVYGSFAVLFVQFFINTYIVRSKKLKKKAD